MSPPLTASDLARDVIRAQVACAIAYEKDGAAVAGRLAELGLERVRSYHDPSTGTDALLVRGSNQAILAIRGTEKDFADIVTDLDFKWVDYQPNGIGRVRGLVHRGFYRAFQSIKAAAAEDIRSLSARGIQTEGVGHSLGGAGILHFAAAGMIHHVTTFGAPRTGDKDFAEHCRDRRFTHRRFVRGADIVPLLPLLVMGARHDTPSLYFDGSGRLHPDAGLKREVFGRALSLLTLDWKKGWTPCPAPRRMFTDHKGAGYIADIERHHAYLESMRELDDRGPA